jgi:hypothetical protein
MIVDLPEPVEPDEEDELARPDREGAPSRPTLPGP